MANNIIKLEQFCHNVSSQIFSASVKLSFNGNDFMATEIGDSSILAVQSAIIKALSGQGVIPEEIEIECSKCFYEGGVATAVVEVKSDGREVSSTETDVDIICAFTKALISAINDLL